MKCPSNKPEELKSIKTKMNFIKENIFKRISLEAVLWIFAVLYLILINPYQQGHLNLCLFHHLGFEHCPGCGIGKSMSFLMHGNIVESIKMHPLGIIAFVLIMHRIVILFREPKILIS